MADDSLVVQYETPDEAFELLSHPVRIEILQTLTDAGTACSFGTLRQESSIDDPGQFNYHLRLLDGRLVTQSDDGYTLSSAGRQLAGTIESGTATARFEHRQLEVGGDCHGCEGALVATFDDRTITIACSECSAVHAEPTLAPGALAGVPRPDIPVRIDRWLKRQHTAAEYGFCPNCDGRLVRRVVVPDDEDAPEWLTGEQLAATVLYDCRRCDTGWQSTLPYALRSHTAVLSAYHDAGIDLRTTPNWKTPGLEPTSAVVRSTDPLAVSVPFTIDDETHRFVVDRSLDLITHQRE